MKLKESTETELPIVKAEDVIARLKNVKKSGNQWTALCPVHKDTRNSFSVGTKPDGTPLLHCHKCSSSGVTYEEYLSALGLWVDINETAEQKNAKVVREHDYVKEDGELAYQVVKLKNKDYPVRRLDKNGNWVYDLKGVERIIYNLPNVIASEDVIVVEGEKDADTLNELGFVATTNSGGAGKWFKEYNKRFKDKNVVIIPDNDPVGFAHGENVAKNVYPTAKSVKIVYLEGLAEKGDVSDWLKTHSDWDLRSVIDNTPFVVYEDEELHFDNTLPNSVESEMAINGAILREGSLITKVIKEDVLSSYYDPTNKKLLRAMIDCFNEKQRVDRITVTEILKQRNLHKIISDDYLRQLILDAPDSINLDSWINIVKGKAKLRKYVDISTKLKKIALNELDDADNIGIDIQQEIHNIRKTQNKTGFSKISDSVDSVIDEIAQLDGGLVGLSTGYVGIDEATSGLQKSDLIIFAGRPSMGKTAIVMNIATNVAIGGGNVAVFSLEMNKAQLAKRIIASEARVDLKAFRSNNLDESGWVRVANVKPTIENAGLYVDDTPAISVPEIRSKLMELKEEIGSLDLIVIDYLQLMTGNGRENRQQEVSQISRDLKSLAREFDVPVIALSQLSRAPEGRANNRPIMSDLRESGSLEQDADVVAFVYRDEYYHPSPTNKGLAEVIFSKQRNDATSTVFLAFIKHFTRFENLIEV